MILALAVAVGLATAVICVAAATRRPREANERALVQALGSPLLAVRPLREAAVRGLCRQLLDHWLQRGRTLLPVVSAQRGEGRTYSAAQLAAGFAALGEKTLLIDADFRSPRQQGIFNIADRFGLSSVLSGRADLSVAAPVAGLTGLAVLPAGPVPPNPLELLSRPSFAALLAKAQQEYDVILIDTPPATEYADAQSIAFRAGDVMLVSRRDITRVEDTERAVKELSDASARIVGTLMNAY